MLGGGAEGCSGAPLRPRAAPAALGDPPPRVGTPLFSCPKQPPPTPASSTHPPAWPGGGRSRAMGAPRQPTWGGGVLLLGSWLVQTPSPGLGPVLPPSTRKKHAGGSGCCPPPKKKIPGGLRSLNSPKPILQQQREGTRSRFEGEFY